MGSTTKKLSGARVPSVTDEFLNVDLGDERRAKRLLSVVEALAAAPNRSLPEIARDDAELEAIYRLLNNEAVDPRAILVPHFKATARRASEFRRVLVIHDGSAVTYALGGEFRQGLGRLESGQGFKLMPALALSGDGSNQPLGLLAMHTWVQDAEQANPKKKSGKKKRRKSWGRIAADRWLRSISESGAHTSKDTRLVHVIDAEGEGYKLFHAVIERGEGFVVRFRKERTVATDEDPTAFVKVSEAAKDLEGLLEVDVDVSERKPKPGQNRVKPRSARTARLTYSARRVQMKKSWDLNQTNKELPEYLAVNLVVVTEPNPPEGEDPVEWLLATSESIETVDDVTRVVATYKARWTIEEFFKALKTGCVFEERQLETFDALQRLLAMFLVVAWKILLLRTAGRVNPDAPAASVMSPAMLWVLRTSGRRQLSANPTAGEVLLAVAALGGHIKNNGVPGLIVLRRGMERLLDRTDALLSALRVLGGAEKK